MRFGSVCSGIDAASVAFTPLGWEAAWFSEIEPFPCEVLKYHYPQVKNLGDMTKLPKLILDEEVEAPDVLCGGTPCQAFSVAGLRRSLDDYRGSLSLVFCEIANAIDAVRSFRGLNKSIIFWENVQGVLNTKDNAFGCFLGGLIGSDVPLRPSDRDNKWPTAGFCVGSERTAAWRVLDAQYFGVPQRRRRVFVVASARNDFDTTKVLFERPSLSGNIEQSRTEKKDTSAYIETGFAQYRRSEQAGTLKAVGGVLGGGSKTFVTGSQIAKTLTASDLVKQVNNHAVDNLIMTGGCTGVSETTAPTIVAGMSHQSGTTQPALLDSIAYRVDSDSSNSMKSSNPHSGFHAVDVSPTLDTTIPTPSKGQGGIDICIAENVIGRKVENGSNGVGAQEELSYTLNATGVHGVSAAGTVRRLTPVECERLQGFPDNYTRIPYRGKPSDKCPDAPRYKAIGNSWAVPCVRWIGERINRELERIEKSCV